VAHRADTVAELVVGCGGLVGDRCLHLLQLGRERADVGVGGGGEGVDLRVGGRGEGGDGVGGLGGALAAKDAVREWFSENGMEKLTLGWSGWSTRTADR
jgi:hypothetical protein